MAIAAPIAISDTSGTVQWVPARASGYAHGAGLVISTMNGAANKIRQPSASGANANGARTSARNARS